MEEMRAAIFVSGTVSILVGIVIFLVGFPLLFELSAIELVLGACFMATGGLIPIIPFLLPKLLFIIIGELFLAIMIGVEVSLILYLP